MVPRGPCNQHRLTCQKSRPLPRELSHMVATPLRSWPLMTGLDRSSQLFPAFQTAWYHGCQLLLSGLNVETDGLSGKQSSVETKAGLRESASRLGKKKPGWLPEKAMRRVCPRVPSRQ